MSHLEEFKIVSDIQHGFRKSYSCETQQSDIILLDFAEAFNTVPNQRLLSKLSVQDAINNCRFKLGRLKNSLVSSFDGNTCEVFRFNAVIWVKGGAEGGGGFLRTL